LNPRVERRRFLRAFGWLLAGLGLPGCARPALDAVARPPEPPPAPPGTGRPPVSLVAGGDCVLGYNLEADVDARLAAGIAPETLYPEYFAGVRALFETADIGIVNLECPFTTRGEPLEKNFNFRARPELVEILKAGAVDVVTCANNHANDYGAEGVADTLATLDTARIGRFGAGLTLADARKPAFVERHGRRIGFVGHYYQSPADIIEPAGVFATAGSSGAAGVYKDFDAMIAMVEDDVRALVASCDVPIAFFHWGREGSYDVLPYQQRLAHRCVELGCRAVLGAHPHRIQGIELHRGAPIVYSLGNFVYGGIKEPSDTLTFLARMAFEDVAVHAEIVPVQYTRWPEAPFRPFVLDGAARDDALQRVASLSSGFNETLPQLRPYL
jgi:poly-gamma-glutamate synthesis protein (capsule biosynthesis protein)